MEWKREEGERYLMHIFTLLDINMHSLSSCMDNEEEKEAIWIDPGDPWAS